MNDLFIKPLFLLKNIFISDQVSHLLPIATDCQQSFHETFFPGIFYRKQNWRNSCLRTFWKNSPKNHLVRGLRKLIWTWLIICCNCSYPLQVLFDPFFTLLSVLGRFQHWILYVLQFRNIVSCQKIYDIENIECRFIKEWLSVVGKITLNLSKGTSGTQIIFVVTGLITTVYSFIFWPTCTCKYVKEAPLLGLANHKYMLVYRLY